MLTRTTATVKNILFLNLSVNSNVFKPDGEDKCEKKWDECKELVPGENKIVESILTSAQFNTISLGDVQIKYVCSNKVLEVLHNVDCPKGISVLKAEQNHSDLLPAVYEGDMCSKLNKLFTKYVIQVVSKFGNAHTIF